jgi:hypothetical protein
MSMLPRRPFRDRLGRRVLALCRLRGDPQDLPYSPALLAAMLVVATTIDTLAGDIHGDARDGLVRSLLSTVVVFGLCGIALALRGLGNRYVQTATALAGSGIVVALAQLPILLLVVPIAVPSASGGADTAIDPLQALLRWALLATLAWQILVYAHIMRLAMDSRFGFALALVVTWLVAYWSLDSVLLGP